MGSVYLRNDRPGHWFFRYKDADGRFRVRKGYPNDGDGERRTTELMQKLEAEERAKALDREAGTVRVPLDERIDRIEELMREFLDLLADVRRSAK